MSKSAVWSSSEGKSEAYGLPGEAVGKLREIAEALDYGIPVLTREWRKQTAYELLVIAELGGGAG